MMLLNTVNKGVLLLNGWVINTHNTLAHEELTDLCENYICTHLIAGSLSTPSCFGLGGAGRALDGRAILRLKRCDYYDRRKWNSIYNMSEVSDFIPVQLHVSDS